MKRLMRPFSSVFFAMCILLPLGTANASDRTELLRQSQRIIFLGDSITFGGHYVAFFDAWLLTQGLGELPTVIDVGLPSETVSGLSEDGHAGGKFPRPDLAERLDRVLALTKPDLVFACYGINCGIYQPLDDDRFRRYQDGIRHLKCKVEDAGATLVLITPPLYDDRRAKKSFSYNAVLDRYADWLLGQREDGWLVVDLHGPMAAEVAKRRETAPDFTFQPDAVHPNIEGHWFMARQLIRWFGDEQAASANSPEKMLAAQRAPAEVMELVGKRMAVLRDAYVSAAGHKRPGVRAGLPVTEALKEAQELSEQIHEKLSARRSTSQYMGHVWHIDENGLMHWDGKPYVRFGFTGNGNSQQLMKAGFDQFTLMPAERWPISGPDPEIVQSVHETSEQLEKAGATYYGTLNAFWPWRYGNLIAESDKAAVFVRDVRDVTEHAGHRLALDLQIRLPIPDVHQDRLSADSTHAVLFDLERGTRLDLSRQVESVTRIDTTPDSDAWREEDAAPHDGPTIRVRMETTVFPESSSLRLVLAMERRSAELPGVNGLPPLWKKGIREFYQRSLIAFRPAYANPGLRGLQFGDEINTFPSSLLTAVTYLDIRHDAVALKAYREWLARRFDAVEHLNHYLGSDHASFQGVEWIVPMHPLLPELARTDDAAEREESWTGAKTAWDLADSVEQLRKISLLQEDFRQWFCGHWLAKYAEMAKEAIGPVPVFVCSAAISGSADQYLAMHRWALREGVDGLIRNHYGHCGVEERHSLTSVARWMAKVQQESGCTKHLWANEVGYVRPDLTDDDWAAAEKAELEAGGSFGSQWAFPSQQSVRDMLVLLNQYGYRGFNRFLINPSSARAVREVQWMAELKPEIVGLVVASKQPPRTQRVTREQAIAAARANSRIEHLLRDVKPVRSTAEYSDQWYVWLVHFYSGDRHIAFASISAKGVVLESGPPETDDRENDNSREDGHSRTNQAPLPPGGP